jgi:hypothetical protein
VARPALAYLASVVDGLIVVLPPPSGPDAVGGGEQTGCEVDLVDEHVLTRLHSTHTQSAAAVRETCAWHVTLVSEKRAMEWEEECMAMQREERKDAWPCSGRRRQSVRAMGILTEKERRSPMLATAFASQESTRYARSVRVVLFEVSNTPTAARVTSWFGSVTATEEATAS